MSENADSLACSSAANLKVVIVDTAKLMSCAGLPAMILVALGPPITLDAQTDCAVPSS